MTSNGDASSDLEPDQAVPAELPSPNMIWDSLFDLSLLRKTLLTQGLYPDDVVGLIRYAALGLTHLCWRNTILEDWHAGSGSLSDVDMMIENAKTSVMARHALAAGLDPEGEGWLITSADSLRAMDDEAVGDLLHDALVDFLDVAFDPDRPLSCGLTLGQVGGDEIEQLIDHAHGQVGALTDKIDDQGAGVVLAFLAAKGRLTCPSWFGSWEWPLRVEAFVSLLRDPDDRWWHDLSSQPYPSSEIDDLDLDAVEATLLAGPEAWDVELLRFCLRQGLGFVRAGTNAERGPVSAT